MICMQRHLKLRQRNMFGQIENNFPGLCLTEPNALNLVLERKAPSDHSKPRLTANRLIDPVRIVAGIDTRLGSMQYQRSHWTKPPEPPFR